MKGHGDPSAIRMPVVLVTPLLAFKKRSTLLAGADEAASGERLEAGIVNRTYF